MSFVSYDDFQVRYENSVPAADEARVNALLDDACALAAGVVGSAYQDGDEVPAVIVSTVCAAVRRAYDNPTGMAGETIGDYSWRAPTAGAGVYFTAAEERTMRRATGRSAVVSLEMTTDLPLPASDPLLGSCLNEQGIVIVNSPEPQDL